MKFLPERRAFIKGLIYLGGLLLPGLLRAGRALARSLFPVNTAEPAPPPFDPESWRLVVDGLVEQPLSLSHEELSSLPRVRLVRDLWCVERWAAPDVHWDGVLLRELLKRARPKPGARFVTFRCSGGVYSESLTLEQALEPETLMAWGIGGKPLPPEHGKPLRLVLPRMWGYKSAKWVERVTLEADRHLGYWEKRGYPADAEIPKARRPRP